MDFLRALQFLVVFELLSLPLRFLLAPACLPADVRRVLSRLAGPLLFPLGLWLLSAPLPGGSWIWGHSPWELLYIVALACVLGRWLMRRLGQSWADLLGYPADRAAYRSTILLELVSPALFFGFVAFRRWVPEMTSEIGASAAEKFMNQMLFWSNWQATRLPAADYWLAGHAISYYDWGQFFWARCGRVAGLPAELALNLALARVTLATFEAAYLLARAVRLPAGWSLAAGVAVAWAGNPAGLRSFWSVWKFSRQAGLPYDWSAYDFWAPSRAIDHVVDEFPAFSAILGDFHAHHLALPWIVAALALLVAGPRWFGWRDSALPTNARRWLGMGLLGLLILFSAATVLANLWNLPILGGMVVLWVIAVAFNRPRDLPVTVGAALFLLLVAFLAQRAQRAGVPPPLEDVSNIGEGFWRGKPVQPVPVGLRSKPLELFGLWGFPALALLLGVFGALLRASWRRAAAGWAALFATFMLIWFEASRPSAIPGGSAWLWLAVVAWVLLFVIYADSPESPPSSPPFRRRLVAHPLAWLALGSCTILAGLELVYVQDRFRGELVRYNSYFKFSYAVWAPWTVIGCCALRELWRQAPGVRPAPLMLRCCLWPLRLAIIPLAVAASVYVVFAMPARSIRAAIGDSPARRPSLDSVRYIGHRPPFNVESPLLEWIRDNTPPGTRIAEAGAHFQPGKGAYYYGGRVASLAGRPVPLGWEHHEQQWRGPVAFPLIEERKRAIDRFYRAPTPEAMRRAALELGIDYAVYGLVEAEHYGPTALDRLRRSAPLAAAFPPPTRAQMANGAFSIPPEGIFLFDFRATGPKMDRP